MDIALFHKATYRMGQSGYTAPRPRGHLEIWHDSKRYLYDIRGMRYLYDIRGMRVSAKMARAFIVDRWNLANGGKISGRFPSYTVED